MGPAVLTNAPYEIIVADLFGQLAQSSVKNIDRIDHQVPSYKIGCAVCGSGTDTTLRKCSGCKAVRYCSDQCQRLAWGNGHKDVCGKMTNVVTSQPDEDLFSEFHLPEATYALMGERCRAACWERSNDPRFLMLPVGFAQIEYGGLGVAFFCRLSSESGLRISITWPDKVKVKDIRWPLTTFQRFPIRFEAKIPLIYQLMVRLCLVEPTLRDKLPLSKLMECVRNAPKDQMLFSDTALQEKSYNFQPSSMKGMSAEFLRRCDFHHWDFHLQPCSPATTDPVALILMTVTCALGTFEPAGWFYSNRRCRLAMTGFVMVSLLRQASCGVHNSVEANFLAVCLRELLQTSPIDLKRTLFFQINMDLHRLLPPSEVRNSVLQNSFHSSRKFAQAMIESPCLNSASAHSVRGGDGNSAVGRKQIILESLKCWQQKFVPIELVNSHKQSSDASAASENYWWLVARFLQDDHFCKAPSKALLNLLVDMPSDFFEQPEEAMKLHILMLLQTALEHCRSQSSLFLITFGHILCKICLPEFMGGIESQVSAIFSEGFTGDEDAALSDLFTKAVRSFAAIAVDTGVP